MEKLTKLGKCVYWVGAAIGTVVSAVVLLYLFVPRKKKKIDLVEDFCEREAEDI